MIKLFKKIKRKRILKDIKKAKKVYEMGRTKYMCNAFKLGNTKYFDKPIDSVIPEFNRETLNAQYKNIYYSFWWIPDDRESRLKAFDKLIEIYSK